MGTLGGLAGLISGCFLIFLNLRRQTSYVKKDAGEGRFWVAEVPIKQVFTFYGDFGGPSGLPPPRQVLVTPPARQLPASEKRRAWNARVDSSIYIYMYIVFVLFLIFISFFMNMGKHL